MSKLKKILAVGLFLSSTFFMGCDDVLSSEDSITLSNVTPAHVNISLSSTETVTIDVDASADVSAASNFTVTASTSYLDCNIAYTTGDKGTATITVDAKTGCPKDTFTVTVTAILGTASSTQTFTVFVTDGVEEIDTLASATGEIVNRYYTPGGNAGFNLVTGAGVQGTSVTNEGAVVYTDETIVDIESTIPTVRATTIGLKLHSPNGALFSTASAPDYAGATETSLTTLAASSVASASAETATLSAGSVVIAHLANSRGTAIIKITAIDESADVGSSNDHTGKISFEYKIID